MLFFVGYWIIVAIVDAPASVRRGMVASLRFTPWNNYPLREVFVSVAIADLPGETFPGGVSETPTCAGLRKTTEESLALRFTARGEFPSAGKVKTCLSRAFVGGQSNR